MDHQADRELTVFREFGLVCPLGIEVDSIEKRNPPEADILCRVPGEGSIAFEMVELVDELRIAKPMADQEQLMDVLRDAGAELPEAIRTALVNAWIGVRFRPALSLRKRRAVAEEIVKTLGADPSFEGQFRIRHGKSDAAQVKVKRRQGLAGPHFRVLTGGFYRPVPLDAIDEKLEKNYPGDAPLELLAYYDRQHAPLEEQLAELATFIEANLAKSPVRRVWVFDRYKQRICYPN